MRSLVFVIALLVSNSGMAAKPAAPPRGEQELEIHVLGKLNINRASRAQLLTVPGLDGAHVEAILLARLQAPISNLRLLQLPAEALSHLKTEGASDYQRIRRLPLLVLTAAHDRQP